MPRGGYQRPKHPAPVSGPGKLSRRTDGGPASQTPAYIEGLPYGEGQETLDLQREAPMAAAEPVRRLTDPTDRPDEPVTAGSPFGAGPGPEVLPQRQEDDAVAALIRYAYALHPSPGLNVLMNRLEAQGR